MSTPTLDDQIACVTREIATRESVYKSRVEKGAMTQQKADWEKTCMKAVLSTLMAARSIAPLAGPR
jgi:hypothetical protein